VKSLGQSILQRGDACGAEVGRAARLIVDTAGGMYDAVHQIIPRLRPFSLDDFGLADALGDLVAEARAGNPEVAVGLEVAELPAQLGDALATGAYRIVQEPLTNALRHAQAKKVTNAVGIENDSLALRVEDDGAGLPADWQRPGHFGLRGMRERASALGGRFNVGTGVRGGVCVLAWLPIH